MSDNLSRNIKVYKLGELVGEFALTMGQDYSLGRATECTVKLDDTTLSRKHLKIYYTGQSWRIECLSRFIPLRSSDSETYDGFDINKNQNEFWLGDFRIVYSENADTTTTSQLAPTAMLSNTEAAGVSNRNHKSEVSPTDDEQRADEITRPIDNNTPVFNRSVDFSTESGAGQNDGTQIFHKENHDISHLEPYVRVVYPSGAPDEILKLEGHEWTAGRDKDCEISLDYTKVSREHFVISKIGNSYFLTDLGSSNGTNLNGEVLSSGQKVPLDSGDKIQIKDLKIYFEIRDSRFQKQLQVLQVDNSLSVQSPQFLPGPAGAVRIPPPQSRLNSKKSNVLRIFAILLIVGAVGYSLLQEESEQQTTSTSVQVKEGFDALTPEQQTYLESTYTLAERLYTDSKYELVLNETRKIHELIPSYKDSRRLETFSQNAIENLRQQEEIKKAEDAQRRLVAQINSILESCERKYSKSSDISAARNCLAPALELDPENQRAAKLTTGIELRLDQARINEQRNRDANASIQRGVASYEKARALHDKGDLLDALEAYNNHIKSPFPDPKNLKEQSKRNVASIKQQISSQIDEMYSKAKNAHDSGDYRNSILGIRKILALDETNTKAIELKQLSEKELTKKARALFEDSILEENLGNIQTAKERWKTIIDLDVPGGDYFIKASAKMKKYGP